MQKELTSETRTDRGAPTTTPDAEPAVPPLPSDLAIGCADLPPGLRRVRYFQRLRYLEAGGTRYQVPRGKVLDRWRAEAGADARFGLHAPQEISDRPGPKGYPRSRRALTKKQLWQAGGFRDTEVIQDAVQSIADACARLGTDVVIFRSPPEFVPSAANRDTLKGFFSQVATAERFGDTARVWEPLGLWEPATAMRLVADLGLVYCCDPLSNDPLAEPHLLDTELPGVPVYFRVTGLGRGRQRFDDYALEPLIPMVEERRAWVVFSHEHKYPDAIRCHRLLATLAAG